MYLQSVKGKVVFGYLLALLPLVSAYLRILKGKCALFLKWTLHNPPKPHAYASWCLLRGIGSGDETGRESPNSEKIELINKIKENSADEKRTVENNLRLLKYSNKIQEDEIELIRHDPAKRHEILEIWAERQIEIKLNSRIQEGSGFESAGPSGTGSGPAGPSGTGFGNSSTQNNNAPVPDTSPDTTGIYPNNYYSTPLSAPNTAGLFHEERYRANLKYCTDLVKQNPEEQFDKLKQGYLNAGLSEELAENAKNSIKNNPVLREQYLDDIAKLSLYKATITSVLNIFIG